MVAIRAQPRQGRHTRRAAHLDSRSTLLIGGPKHVRSHDAQTTAALAGCAWRRSQASLPHHSGVPRPTEQYGHKDLDIRELGPGAQWRNHLVAGVESGKACSSHTATNASGNSTWHWWPVGSSWYRQPSRLALSPNGENRSIPRRLKNLGCCPQTRPLSPETLRPGRPSLASQSSRIKPFKPEPNERIGLYSFLLRAHLSELTIVI